MHRDAEWTQAPCIMFVDPQPGMRRTARTVLEQEGFKVLTAANSVEALVLAADYPFPIDVLMTDGGMRVYQNGLELAECFAILRPETRVVVTSDDASGLAENRGTEWDTWDRLAKPYIPAQLIRAAAHAADLAGVSSSYPR